MTIKAIEDYVKERDEALASFDVAVLEKFVIENVQYIGKDVVNMFIKADAVVKMAALCKMICNAEAFYNTETREKAVKWLKKHHMSTW